MNNTHDLAEKRFTWMESQVTYINHNVSLLIVALVNNIGLFIEDGGFNVEFRLEGNWFVRKN